ncbi:unnamed protein product [Nippostrongylus brasiliensis]|uniref:Uncharacterized protein n=1 Tax=Nippostrongylus brasiliensis TaxID=27835 RepID=A0A0N4XVJ8_NIPBR|nr:unnamed protein product [Nippostrongylus brasiliensis]
MPLARGMSAVASLRDSRATTEEASDEDATNEHRPLLPQPRIASGHVMKRSLTTLNTSTTSAFTKSTSCSECRKADAIDPSDTDDTMTSSATSSCPRHMTLFSSTFGKSIKETFL